MTEFKPVKITYKMHSWQNEPLEYRPENEADYERVMGIFKDCPETYRPLSFDYDEIKKEDPQLTYVITDKQRDKLKDILYRMSRDVDKYETKMDKVRKAGDMERYEKIDKAYEILIAKVDAMRKTLEVLGYSAVENNDYTWNIYND